MLHAGYLIKPFPCRGGLTWADAPRSAARAVLVREYYTELLSEH